MMIQWYLIAIGMLLLGLISPWFFLMGCVMLTLSLWSALVAAFTTQLPFNLSSKQKLKKLWVVGSMHFLHPLVRSTGRLLARLRSGRDAEPVRLRSWRLSNILRECAKIRPGARQIARYWGPMDRIAVLKELRTQIKNSGFRARLGEGFDNFDLFVGTSFLAEGQFVTATEDFGRSLCLAFRGRLSGPARLMLCLMTATAVVCLVSLPWIGIGLGVTTALFASFCLAEKARLRGCVWESVERDMQQRQAVRLEGDQQ